MSENENTGMGTMERFALNTIMHNLPYHHAIIAKYIDKQNLRIQELIKKYDEIIEDRGQNA